MLPITIQSNKAIPVHFDAEISPGYLTIVVKDVKKDEGPDVKTYSTKEFTRFDVALNDARGAIDVLRHFRWEVGKLIDAMRAQEAQIAEALKVPEVAVATVAEEVEA